MRLLLALLLATLLAACSAPPSPSSPAPAQPAPSATAVPEPKKEAAPVPQPKNDAAPAPAASTEKATFATGCFWCSEAIIQRLPGVISVRSGYTGGTVAKPSYEDVCTGSTGHAEAIEITFDPKTITYETLLDWFWRMHDPTTLNRQGPDAGTQYRSAIFYHSDAQRAAAEKSKKDAQSAFKDPIVTEITKAGPFYAAEDYHQGFYNGHKTQGYCRAVIAPKLHKLGLEDK
jgi:peptide-methionine (S)-S-oxide reductase